MPKMYIKNLDKEIKISSILSIFNNLAENGISLVNRCGGKGICGLCRIKVTHGDEKFIKKHTDAEKKHISEDDLKEGYRLACQTFTLKDIEIEFFGAKISNNNLESGV